MTRPIDYQNQVNGREARCVSGRGLVGKRAERVYLRPCPVVGELLSTVQVDVASIDTIVVRVRNRVVTQSWAEPWRTAFRSRDGLTHGPAALVRRSRVARDARSNSFAAGARSRPTNLARS